MYEKPGIECKNKLLIRQDLNDISWNNNNSALRLVLITGKPPDKI